MQLYFFSGQVTLAQEAEVMFATKRELSQLREQNKELLRSLSASEEQISELKLKKQVEIIVLDKFKFAFVAINSMPDSEIISGFILLWSYSWSSDNDGIWHPQIFYHPVSLCWALTQNC